MAAAEAPEVSEMADRKIKNFQEYLAREGLALDTATKGIGTTLTIKKGDTAVAHIKYDDFNEPPNKAFKGDMEIFDKPTIYVHQVTRFDDEYKGIGKSLMQYVAALAAKQNKMLGFTATSNRGDTEKLVRYYNSIGANKVDKRLNKNPWGPGQRMLARKGVLYKTNDPLKIVSSGGGRTRKREIHRKRKQTRRF